MSEKAKRSETRNETTPEKPRTNSRGNRRGISPASQANLKPIQPGQVLNPDGWPKGKRRAETLARLAFDKLSLAVLDKVNAGRKARKLSPLTLEESGVDAELDMWVRQCEKARNGDTKAFEVVNGYLHGKPTTNLQVSGDPENPIKHEHDFAEVEAEVASWIEGWFPATKKTKVTVKKKHGNKNTDTGTAQ